MNPILATTILAGTTWVAKMAKDESLGTNQIISFFVVAVILGFIYTIDRDLGNKFSWLVVVAAVLAHYEPLRELTRP